MTREQGIALLLSMTPAESRRLAARTAELAELHDDLGAGIRGALEEMAAQRQGVME